MGSRYVSVRLTVWVVVVVTSFRLPEEGGGSRRETFEVSKRWVMFGMGGKVSCVMPGLPATTPIYH